MAKQKKSIKIPDVVVNKSQEIGRFGNPGVFCSALTHSSYSIHFLPTAGVCVGGGECDSCHYDNIICFLIR